MPVVPFAPQPPKGRALPKPIELSAAEEPWVLMAAAKMHQEGRLMQPTGQREAGNINLNNRPQVKNPDGSTSTVRSITVTNDDGSAVLIPTVVGDKVVSNADAIAHFKKTGEHLGKFDTEEAADAYAEDLHKKQAKQYGLE